MSKYDVILMLLIIIFVTSFLGGQFGYTVKGVPKNISAGELESQAKYRPVTLAGSDEIVGYIDIETGETIAPSDTGALSSISDAMKFFYDILLFRIDDMPGFVNIIFWIANLITLALIFYAIRSGG